MAKERAPQATKPYHEDPIPLMAEHGMGTGWGIYTGQRSTPPAYRMPWRDKVPVMHVNLSKAERTVATLLRTRVIGLNDFLCMDKVQGVNSLAYPGKLQSISSMPASCTWWVETSSGYKQEPTAITTSSKMAQGSRLWRGGSPNAESYSS